MRSLEPRHIWATGLARTIAEELRHGVATGAVTWGEADELLNRLRTVIDQALDVPATAFPLVPVGAPGTTRTLRS